jgi:hypothetical protein
MNWPPDLKYVTPYLHRQDVMSRIHVDGKKSEWTECSNSVFTAFRAYRSEPSIKLLPDLLRQIPIVLYSGEYDLICNHWATESMIDAMTWNNGTGFDLGNGTLAPTEPWNVEGESAGLIRTARNLTYILFYNASHMVPYNYARRSRVMLHKFMQLDLTSITEQTTKKNTEETNQTGFIALAVIITIIALTGLAWLFVRKWQQARIPTPFKIMRVLRSNNRDVDRWDLVLNPLLDDENEEFNAIGVTTSV